MKLHAPKLKISDAEWQVMEILWSTGSDEIPSDTIVTQLQSTTDWSEGTIRTLLNRLGKKGAIQSRREGRRYLYSTARTREDCLKSEMNQFLRRFFGGRLSPMMAQFLGNEEIDKRELDRLEAMIQEKRKQLEDES